MDSETQNKLHAAVADLHKTSLELQQTRAQLENEVVEIRDQKEKILELYGKSLPCNPPDQYSSAGVMMQHNLPAGKSFPPSDHINTIKAKKKSSGPAPTGEDMVLQTTIAQERSSLIYMSGWPKQVVLPNSPLSNSRISALSSDDVSYQKPCILFNIGCYSVWGVRWYSSSCWC